MDISQIEAEKITPPIKPDIKDGQVDFKYFNLKQQNVMDSFLPVEKVQKVKDKQNLFDKFDQMWITYNKPSNNNI